MGISDTSRLTPELLLFAGVLLPCRTEVLLLRSPAEMQQRPRAQLLSLGLAQPVTGVGRSVESEGRQLEGSQSLVTRARSS